MTRWADNHNRHRGEKAKALPLLSALHISLEAGRYLLIAGIILLAVGRVMNPSGFLVCLFLTAAAGFFLKGWLRFWPLVLPIGVMIQEIRSLGDVCLLLPPFLLLGMAIAKEFEADYYHTADGFSRNTVVYLLGGILGLVFGNSWALPMALVCLVVQVFLLRILRQEKDHILTKTSLLLEMTLMTGLCLVCLLVGSQTFRDLLGAGFSLAFSYLVMPVMRLLIIALSGIVWLVQKILGPIELSQEEPQQMLIEDTMDYLRQAGAVESGNSLIRQILEGIIVIVVLIFAIRWLVIRYRSHTVAEGEASRDTVETVRTRVEREKGEGSSFLFRDRSPRGRIRRAYAKYLRTVERAGHRIDPSHTSLDVHRRMAGTEDEKKAARLRQLYLAARYDSSGEVTVAEAEQAVVLEKELRK